MLPVPGAFLASAVYRWLLLIVNERWPRVRRVLIAVSCGVLTGIIVEWGLLAFRGAVGARVLVGPAYYTSHVVLFFLGCPALMNILVLTNPSRWYARRWLTLTLSTMLAFVLVFQQYAVFEALYGIDGVDGPYSQIDRI